MNVGSLVAVPAHVGSEGREKRAGKRHEYRRGKTNIAKTPGLGSSSKGGRVTGERWEPRYGASARGI